MNDKQRVQRTKDILVKIRETEWDITRKEADLARNIGTAEALEAEREHLKRLHKSLDNLSGST